MKTLIYSALLLTSAFYLSCAKDQPASDHPVNTSTGRGDDLCDLGAAINLGTRSSSTIFNFTKSLDFSIDQSDLVLSALSVDSDPEVLCTYSLTDGGYLKLQVNGSEDLIITAATASSFDQVETYDLSDLTIIMIDNVNGTLNFIGTMDIRPTFERYFPLDTGVKIKVNPVAETIEFRY